MSFGIFIDKLASLSAFILISHVILNVATGGCKYDGEKQFTSNEEFSTAFCAFMKLDVYTNYWRHFICRPVDCIIVNRKSFPMKLIRNYFGFNFIALNLCKQGTQILKGGHRGK